MPRVSVIVPVFNEFSFLREALDSVLAQTYRDFEIVIVDDGSKSDIAPFIPDSPFIKLVKQRNLGLGAARNVGVAHSSGELIAFLDGDDYWKPAKLERQVDLMDANPDAGFGYTKCEMVDENNNTIGSRPERGSNSYLELLRNYSITPSGAIVRRRSFSIAGGFDPLHTFAQDMDFFLKVARHSGVVYLDEELTCYRVHIGNRSRKTNRAILHGANIFDKHIAHALSIGDPEIEKAARQGAMWVRMQAASDMLDYARQAIDKGQYLDAISYLVRSTATARSIRPVLHRLHLLLLQRSGTRKS